MKLSQIVKDGTFFRDSSSHEDILDDYWSLEISEIVDKDETLRKYGQHLNQSFITLSIAGKEGGPDSDALRTACRILDELDTYLMEFKSKVVDGGRGWSLDSICIPYQIEPIWYLRFFGEGEFFEYYFIRKSQSVEYEGQIPNHVNNGSVLDVMHTIKYVVEELAARNRTSESILFILSSIQRNKTIGLDLIKLVGEEVKDQKALFENYMYEHLKRKIESIKHHSRDV